jgi:hypothetical protein
MGQAFSFNPIARLGDLRIEIGAADCSSGLFQ